MVVSCQACVRMCPDGVLQDQSTELAETPGSRLAADCVTLIGEGQLSSLLSRLLAHSDLLFSKSTEKGQCRTAARVHAPCLTPPFGGGQFVQCKTVCIVRVLQPLYPQTWSAASASSAIWRRACRRSQQLPLPSRSPRTSRHRQVFRWTFNSGHLYLHALVLVFSCTFLTVLCERLGTVRRQFQAAWCRIQAIWCRMWNGALAPQMHELVPTRLCTFRRLTTTRRRGYRGYRSCTMCSPTRSCSTMCSWS